MAERNCENCEDEPAPIATLHCYKCKASYCDDCAALLHKAKATRAHALVSIAEYRKYNDNYIPTEEDHKEDLQNEFVCVDHERQSVVQGRRFYSLDEIDENEDMPVVSFVGPTGAGKSTLIRLFCNEDGAKPASSDPQSIESTSADIHAYVGACPTQSPFKILLLDCEGINGTTPSAFKTVFKHLPLEKLNKLLDIRKDFVNSAFPRLLYMFSSVFCFMFNGSAKEQQTWVGYITTYASAAAAATVNQLTLPALIVVFNKVTTDEGIWNIDEASAKFQDIGDFKNLFQSVKVVCIYSWSFVEHVKIDKIKYIPDRKADGKCYSEQVQALQELVATSINNQRIYSKKVIMQLFSYALPEFSENPKGVFNFMNIAMRNRPLPQDFPTYLQEFFYCIFEKEQRLGHTPQQAFDEAAEKLSERLLDTFLLHMGRNNIAIPSGIPEGLRTIIDQVESVVQGLLPCTATHSFEQVEGSVSCESSQKEHGEVHQSSKTYTTMVPKQGFFARLFGEKTEVSQSCRWEGAIQISDKYASPGWLADSSILKTSGPVVPSVLIRAHKDVLSSQSETLTQIDTDRLCLACLLQVPTEILQCRHKLCVPCCEELRGETTGTTECPFCKTTSSWHRVDIPDVAGIRVLTIDGGCARGVISAVILQHIEEQLHIPIRELFDFIVGTSFGGLTTLAFGAMQYPGEDVVKLFEGLRNAFQPTDYFGFAFLGWWKYRCKYYSAPLRTAIAEVLHDVPLFGSTSFPRLAVLACDVSDGVPKNVLFTSYNSTKKSDVRCATLVETAEASVAGVYFEKLSKQYGTFIDGGVNVHNPCELGYEEAKRLWKDKSLDFLLSVGSGAFPPESCYGFEYKAKCAEINANSVWEKLQALDEKDKMCRLNPVINRDLPMDAYANIGELTQKAEDEFSGVFNKLLAKLFYMEPPTSLPTENWLLILKTRTRVPQIEKINVEKINLIFVVEIKFDGAKKQHAEHVISIVDGAVQICFSNMPSKGNIEVQVQCHLAHDGSAGSDSASIAGSPLKISREGKDNE